MPIRMIPDNPVSDGAVERGSHPRAKGDPSVANAVFTCPMHPEVQLNHPGECPKCGMTLEPKTVKTGTDDETAELRNMTRRFWFGAALAMPVFLLAMAHLIPALARQPWVGGDSSRWLQFALTALVVVGAGWPLLRRG